MVISVKRGEHESFESALRKFNRRVQQSGVLSSAKKRMYREKDITRKERKDQALRKEMIKGLKKKKLLMGK